MPRIRVLPYLQGSKSAKTLSRALGGLRLRLENSRFRPRQGDIVINWGSTRWPNLPAYNDQALLFNRPSVIPTVSNKLTFFNLMATNNADIIPQFWTNKDDIPNDCFPIVCRTVLAGHSGAGIVIADTSEQLVDAPLYTQYIPKQDEYRIHVGKGNTGESEIISIQRKARRQDHEDPNWRVRNHCNGFVFVRGGVNPPASTLDAAKRALTATGLDFGAVDVIYNTRRDRSYVLEINTAPGLEGQTVDDYVSFFQQRINAA